MVWLHARRQRRRRVRVQQSDRLHFGDQPRGQLSPKVWMSLAAEHRVANRPELDGGGVARAEEAGARWQLDHLLRVALEQPQRILSAPLDAVVCRGGCRDDLQTNQLIYFFFIYWFIN